MSVVTLIGIDLEKHNFHLHARECAKAWFGNARRRPSRVHAFLLEFGISLPKGSTVIKRLPAVLAEGVLRDE